MAADPREVEAALIGIIRRLDPGRDLTPEESTSFLMLVAATCYIEGEAAGYKRATEERIAAQGPCCAACGKVLGPKFYSDAAYVLHGVINRGNLCLDCRNTLPWRPTE